MQICILNLLPRVIWKSWNPAKEFNMQPLIRLNDQSYQTKQSNSITPCTSCISQGKCICKALNLDISEMIPKQFVHRFKIKKGDPIFHSGDDIHSIYNLKMGFAKVEYTLPNGQHQINEFAISGDLLGLDGIADGKHHLDAYALSDGEICSISFNKLQNIINTDREAAVVIEKYMSDTLNRTQEHIFSLGTHSAEEKLAFFLINYRNRMAKLHMRTDTLRLPMSREDLRSYLGVTIETLSRSFTFLEKNGCIEVKNREINFIDGSSLEKFILKEDQAHQLCHQIYGGKKFASTISVL